MSFDLEDPSFLGMSPRRPLPTTSLDHADLVTPMGVLDLSDAEEEEATFAEGDEAKSVAGAATIVGDAGLDETVVPPADNRASSEKEETSYDTLTTTSAESSAASPAVPTTPAASSTTGDVSSEAKTTPAPASTPTASSEPNTTPVERQKRAPSPGGKKKTVGRVVASRYMSEANKASKPPVPQARNNSSRTTPTKSQAPVRTTPKPSPATPKAPVRGNTPKPSPLKQPAHVRSGTATTPTSTQRTGGLSDHDLYLASVIMGRTAKILAVEMEEKREDYLKAATSVLTAGTVAILQLFGKNNEYLHQLFEAQCEFKASSLAAVTKETWLSAKKIDQTMDKFNELEEALQVKGRELSASDSISLPMSDDPSGQSAIVDKIVGRLRKQMDAFQSIETALPIEIRLETNKLAESLSGLEGEVGVTIEQMKACCKHLKKCLNVLVDFIYKVREQREA